ncbi:30S ribosomal protein S6--L-glutamate ligase [Cellvibrio japonicus]|uniref:Probable alpha-L-glutamate ligase n=1 Tax=Cellvibrio japonicus (strain Ueda107) TaxID=498211 RepID=RIMK_CELJU|nr:30S ribosomal protein S6--L-glutamate ligase [Cellvibrio japonicus]B3PCD4.1 RecName: Full=Probable alpha-L-glutamate ligase [Cellvibrio japonicus Ueda107]ACE82853.1 ribosomal protein S6 modification protein [Cellvibrio japonicus Ueda107]QEI11842.1 30S ribosomal protein S6--L-glutamate ligase [Cellvibrio japonicus]QEI15416.1 30S ribosomal protein S6--L-glutamate ligase [Cellvibrio japonicus]QEI18995.1 30S ribosomal protein S6--L-glutamate ligase [Cellvibrio japonicus]
MKIAILSRNRRLYSTRRLVEACTQRGHEVRVIDILKCYIDIASASPAIWYMGEKLEGFDAVIPRIGASVTHYGLAVIRQFEMMGVYCLTESIALGRSRDKLRALQLLSRKGIGLPKTSFAYNVYDARELIKLVGGTPLVLKLCEGTQGKGIVLAETQKAAESVIEAFRELRAEFLVQEFIKEANGSDVRCFVVGDKVVASMERTAQDGEFRSNLHRGGTAKVTKLSPTERRTAIKAAQTMGLKVAGVDLLRSSRGPLVMEVNSSPGLEGIESATGKDIAGLIVAYMEENAKPVTTTRAGKG